MIKYLFVLIFCLVFYVFDYHELGYSYASGLHTHFTYMFGHLSLAHLLINSLAFITIFRVLEKFTNKYILTAVIICIAIAVSFISIQNLPTVGASVMIYSMFGGYISFALLQKAAVIKNRKRFMLFVAVVLFFIITGFFRISTNAYAHLWGFVIGLLVFGVCALYNNKKRGK